MNDEVWTTEEAALYLKVSEDTIGSKAKKGKIPGAIQVSSLWRFRSQKLRTIGMEG